MEDKKKIIIDSLKEIQEKFKRYDPNNGEEHNYDEELSEMKEITSILKEIDEITLSLDDNDLEI